MKLHTVADGISIAAGLGTMALLGNLYWPRAEPLPQFEDVRLEPEIGIDFTARPRTLVMVIQSSCGYCQESAPFYRRIIERDAADVQVVVAAPSTDAGIDSYLTETGLRFVIEKLETARSADAHRQGDVQLHGGGAGAVGKDVFAPPRVGRRAALEASAIEAPTAVR